MNTTILYTKEIWSDETLYRISLDGKLLYFYFLCGPDRGYLPVFKYRKRFAVAHTGLNETQIDVAIETLVEKGFIELYEDYICIKKVHIAPIGGPYGAINTARELKTIPVEVAQHFGLEHGAIIEVTAKPEPTKKTGPRPETIAEIIKRQHPKLQEALKDFVADRIERKHPPTTRAVKGWLNKLHAMYPNDHDKQAASMYQSIDRGWSGLFEVKEDAKKESAFL